MGKLKGRIKRVIHQDETNLYRKLFEKVKFYNTLTVPYIEFVIASNLGRNGKDIIECSVGHNGEFATIITVSKDVSDEKWVVVPYQTVQITGNIDTDFNNCLLLAIDELEKRLNVD